MLCVHAGAAVTQPLDRSHGVDVTERNAVENAFAELGPVDLLVNNAGTIDAIGPAWAGRSGRLAA